MTRIDDTLGELAVRLGRRLGARRWRMVTAESCTAGGVAYAITLVPGSSAWFERGYVTYSNASKVELLGVNMVVIDQHGAVSEAVAREMAVGALRVSGANASLAVTGIAGPDGGSAAKPVGTVCFACAVADRGDVRVQTTTRRLPGDRHAVRTASIVTALQLMIAAIDDVG